ncbi:MAG: glycosyltransferase family 4 protein [Clostridiales bacterium]|nr:glycosyltransferase family 4 protein [Clostridiales bacterium]
MKILEVNQHYWPENFRITEICETLAERGHDVTALVGLPNYPTGVVPKEYKWFRNRKQERNGVHIRRCFEIGRKPGKIGLAINYVSFTLSCTLKALLMKKDFDVIYSFSTSPVLMSLPGAILKRITGKPLVIYVLDLWPHCLAIMNIPAESRFYKFMGKVSKWIYEQADVLLYSSKRFQKKMLDAHGIQMPDEHYLPQFADDIFENALPSKTFDGTYHLVFAGNVGKVQGMDVLMKAAAALKDEPIHWHIVGDGSYLEDCKALARELTVEDRITFHGRKPLEEMLKYYAMADAMLVSMSDNISINDTLPGKVQSYMAVGKPILGTAGGETIYAIETAECGYCTPADDTEAFVAAVRKFISEPENHQKMGENGQKYYNAHFTKKYHMDKLEQLFRALTGKE